MDIVHWFDLKCLKTSDLFLCEMIRFATTYMHSANVCNYGNGDLSVNVCQVISLHMRLKVMGRLVTEDAGVEQNCMYSAACLFAYFCWCSH